MKHLGIRLPKDMQDLYIKKLYNITIKNKGKQINRKMYHVH